MSNYVVSARKYRPATFDEVVGQNHVARTLKNALQTDQLAHAFLFCGPRGVGKTTSARILAKVINCETPKNEGTEPCDNCSSCQSFNDNASFNIIELDAASNNSVEHIRTLIEQVRFQPQQGKYKVFIIDEVHMLSTQAFNAFLKTLEEPPEYAIFILATTEKHKIIPTILSRCQIFDFKRIQVNEIVEQLKHINEKENRTADPEALHLIASKADGAMRDALSIYDKIASASGESISYASVVENLNILDYEYYFRSTDALIKGQIGEVFILFDEILKKGFEPDQFVLGLAEHMRQLLVSKDPKTISLLEAGSNLKERYYNQATLASRSFLMSALTLLNECDLSLPRSSNKRLATEVALGKINYIRNLITADHFEEKKTEESRTIKPALESFSTETHSANNTKLIDPQPIESISKQPPPSQESIKIEPIAEIRTTEAITVDSDERDSRTTDDDSENTNTENEDPQEIKLEEELPEKGSQSDSDNDAQESTEVIKSKIPNDHKPSSKPEESGEIEPKSGVTSESANNLINTPSFSTYSHLVDQIKTEETKKAEARKSLSIEAIEGIWKDYSDNNPSKSISTALNLGMKELIGTTLKVLVPTGITRDMILQESALLERIRREMGVDDLNLDVSVDVSKFPGFEEVET